MKLEYNILNAIFLNNNISQIKRAIKYQTKFQLTYENLKCINSSCNQMKKWGATQIGFLYTCGNKNCILASKQEINKRKLKKSKQTYFNKTGYENSLLNPDIQKIRKSNTIKNTGVEHNKQKHLYNYYNWNNKEFWINNFITIDNNFDLYKCMKYFNCSQSTSHIQMKKFKIDYIKHNPSSLQEIELYSYITNILPSYLIKNNIKKIIKINNKFKELDIYIPELQLAIEYNGIYYHSYHPDKNQNIGPKQSNLEYMMYRHQQKSIACLEQGIRLLHLYEDQTEEEQYSLIDKFLINEYNVEATTFSLDNGCYPNNIEVEILEPEARTVCNNRTIWNAGQIKIKDFK